MLRSYRFSVEITFKFKVPKWELTSLLLYLSKTSNDLRTRLRRTIEGNLSCCKQKIIFRSKCRLNTFFRFKDSLEKKISLEEFIATHTYRTYKVTEKFSVTFTPERFNTWGPLILQENALKTLSSLQYLTIYFSGSAQQFSIILIS